MDFRQKKPPMIIKKTNKYSIRLYFDKETELLIFNLWQRLQKIGLTVPNSGIGQKPHITIGSTNKFAINSLKEKFIAYSNQVKCFNVQFNSLGFFINNKVLYLSPVMTFDILQAHFKFQEMFKKCFYQQEDFFQLNQWEPHCTLAINYQEENFFYIIRYNKKISFSNRRTNSIIWHCNFGRKQGSVCWRL